MRPLRRRAIIQILSLAVLLAVPVTGGPSAMQASRVLPAAESTDVQEATFTLDNVTVNVRTPFLPVWVPGSVPFTISEPGSVNQIATAAAPLPFRTLSIIAVPFGTAPSIEAVPVAQSGGAKDYLLAMHAYEEAGNGVFDANGPTATLFGQQVTGQMSLVLLQPNVPDAKPTLVVTWAVEAGPRLWIVRITQKQDDAVSFNTIIPFIQSLSGLVLSSDTLDRPSTLDGKTQVPVIPKGKTSPIPAEKGDEISPPLPPEPDVDPNTISVPPWWSGDCNVGYHPGSFALGATFMGLKACGPLPRLGYGNQGVDFGPGGLPGAYWGALEWECVELVLRYMRLRLNVNPYPGHGYQTAGNYANNEYNPGGPELQLIENGYQPPAPQVGDILSYGAYPSHGHTSVVKSVNVGSNGWGSINVIEQNNEEDGESVLQVQNWFVQGNAGAVTGWRVGEQHYQPALGRNQDGTLEIFVRGRNSVPYYSKQTTPNGSWSGWISLGGAIRGNLAVVEHQQAGVLEVYAIGAGETGHMYRKWQTAPNSATWTDWVYWPAPVKFQGNPVAIRNGLGGAHVFGWGADNQIWYNWQTQPSGAWQGWSSLGGIGTGNVAIELDASNRVTAFVRGTDFAVYRNQQLAASSASWTGWTSMGGILDSGLSVGRNTNGALEVFGIGTDGYSMMYHNWQTCANCGWNGWASLGGQWNRHPAVTKNLGGALEIFAIERPRYGTYLDRIYHKSQLNGWNGWSFLEGYWHVGTPAFGMNLNGRLSIVARGDDRHLYIATQTAQNSLTWGSWSDLGGVWP